MSFEAQNRTALPRRGGPVDPTHTSHATLEAMDWVALVVGAFMMLMPLAITAYSNPYYAASAQAAKITTQR